MDWDFRLTPGSEGDPPLYQRVAQAIAADIRRGRLRPGVAMPGTRRLAAILGVHRNTTVAAYRDLMGEGLIATRPGHGTFVAETPSPTRPLATMRARPQAVAYPLQAPAEPEVGNSDARGMLSFSHLPEPALAPRVALARAYRRALARQPAAVLDYANRHGGGVTFGHPRLRRALAEMLARSRGLPAGAEDVLITSGSQMAIYLAALALVRPGDVIAVEGLGYRPVWEALRLAGATLVPIAVDERGLCVEDLERLAARTSVRAVYVTPHHQHPSGVAMAPERRAALLRLAVSAQMAILEDDYDHDFEYEGSAPLPLASADCHGAVIYVGSLAKVLAPGSRVGFAVAPAPVLELMAQRRGFIDRQGDHALDCAVADLIEDGDLRRHVQRVGRDYRVRRDALAEGLARTLGDVLAFELPARGTAIWAQVHPGIDVDAWHAAARQRGVEFCPGRRFTFDDRPCAHARFGFAGLPAAQRDAALERLKAALDDVRGRSVPAWAVPRTIRKADLLGRPTGS